MYIARRKAATRRVGQAQEAQFLLDLRAELARWNGTLVCLCWLPRTLARAPLDQWAGPLRVLSCAYYYFNSSY